MAQALWHEFASLWVEESALYLNIILGEYFIILVMI